MLKKYKEVIIILLFALFSVLIFRNYFFNNQVPFPANLLVSFYEPWVSYGVKDYPNGPPNKPIGFDNLRIFYPLRKLTVEEIKNFQLPLWNPYSFSGNTQLATYQSAVFHPLSFLFFILPQVESWSLIIILSPFFSALFMHLFLKELSLSRKSCFFGAITFAFSGFMIVWWEESFMSVYSSLFLPLILYSTYRIFKKTTALDFFLLTLGLTFSILSGWFQMTFYVWVFSLLFVFFLYFKEHKKDFSKLLIIFSSFVLSILISSIHLLPGLEAYFYSARGSTDAKFLFETYLVPFYHLITFLAPDFFGNPGTYTYFGKGFYYEKVIFLGIPALVFGLYKLFQLKGNTQLENFFKWMFLITLSLGIALPTSWIFLYHLKLPFISVVLPSRIFFLSVFCMSVLSAFGIEDFFNKSSKKRFIIIFITLGIIFGLLGGWALYYKGTSHITNEYAIVPLKNLALPFLIYLATIFLIFIYLKYKKLNNHVFIGLILISLLSSFYFANKYLYFSQREFVFPNTPVLSKLKEILGIDRFWGVGRGSIERNFGAYYNIFSPEGYDSLYIKRYGELIFAAQNKGKFSDQIQRADAKLTYAKNLNEIIKNDSYRRRLISLLGVKYILVNKKNNDAIKDNQELRLEFENVWEDDKFIIYKYKEALPRTFITGNYILEKEGNSILNLIFNSKTDLRKTVILEENPEIEQNTDIKSDIKIISYTPNKIEANVKTDKDSLLFISDNYYPGWRATVDDRETKIYRANYSFRSIVLPKGNHKVIFQFEPLSFKAGLIWSCVGLLIFSIILFKIKKDGKT